MDSASMVTTVLTLGSPAHWHHCHRLCKAENR